MRDLAAYQRHVATALGTVEPTDLRGADVSRWSVQQWAAAIAQGHDPVELPHAALPVLVYREPGGRLATAFAG